MGTDKKLEKLIDDKTSEKMRDYTIFNLNEDGRIEDWNESALKILGYNGKEVKGRSFKFFFGEKEIDTRKFTKLIEKAAKYGKTSSESVLVRKDHSTFKATILINSIYDDNHHVIGFSVILGDLTLLEKDSAGNGKHGRGDANQKQIEERAAEKLEQGFEMISNSLSHDLRAPLRAIEGYIKVLSEDYSAYVDDEGKRLLQAINANTKKMSALIENLVAFSRVNTRKLVVSSVNIEELINNITAELNKNELAKIELKPSKLPTIDADYSLMSLAFTHLLSNAIKFSSKSKHPHVKISSETKDKQVQFTVEDNGVGFEMKYADKLFESFQRLHNEEDFEGSGVGLVIVKLIISKHGGKIWVNAEPDKGAKFYFTLPTNN